MTQQARVRVIELEKTVLRLGNGIIEAVAEIDQTDGSRISLQESLDSARSALETAYGDHLTHDVNVFLGIESEDEDEETDSDEDDEDDDE